MTKSKGMNVISKQLLQVKQSALQMSQSLR